MTEWNGIEFATCIQGHLKHYVESSTREETELNLILENEDGQLAEVSVGTNIVGQRAHSCAALFY